MNNAQMQVEAETQLRETKKGKQFLCERCKRWRSWDLGHSEGNECIICWAEIERKILAFVKSASWRREDTITAYMVKQEPTLHFRRVEEWLAELVEVEGSLEWFSRNTEEKMGTNAYSSEPLRYRFVPKRRREKYGNRGTRRHQRPVRKLQATA